MSFNHLTTDHCTYTRHLKQSVSILDYVMSPYRFEHKDKCRHALGLVGGPQVSHVSGNLVDLESDLRGQTRYSSKYCNNQHIPIKTPGQKIFNDKTEPIDTSALHLPTCQMISYKSVPLPPSN
jgi:hypothetical protein